MKKRIEKKETKVNGFLVNVEITESKIEMPADYPKNQYSVNTEGQGVMLTAMLEGIDPDKLPVIEVTRANAQQLREYNRSTKQNAKAGFQIKIADVPAYGIFQFEDGSFKTDNLFDIMITAVGNARQSEGMVRAIIDRAQRYAHDVKRNIATYNHFYGTLDETQKAWMLENTVSYEHEMSVQKEAAKLRNGGQ